MVNAGFAWRVAWLAWALVLARVIATFAEDAPAAGAQVMLRTPLVSSRGFVVAAVSAPPSARAEASDFPSAAARRALDELLDGSGLKGQLESLSASVRAQFLRSPLREQDRVTIDRTVSAHFDAEALYARIGLELAQNLDGVRLAQALAWYHTPLGRRLTALELAAAQLEDGPDRPSPRRLALVERLDAGLGGSETTVDVTVAVVRSLVRAFQPALPVLAPLSPSQLDEQLALARNGTLARFRPAYLASMLASYRSLSDAELTEYLQFVESEAGRWFISQTNSALLRAIDVAAAATAAELATALSLAAEPR